MRPPAGKAKAAAPLTAEDKELLKLAQHLLSSVPTTDRGILVHPQAPPQKVRVFRADKLIEYMMSPDNKKYGLEKVKTKEEAVALADRLLTFDRPKLFVKCERRLKTGSASSEKLGGLRLVDIPDPRSASNSKFQTGEDVRYVWLYEGDTTWNSFKLVALILGIIALCLFQLWPPFLRVAVWYIAVTLLLVLFLTTVVQLLVYLIAWLAGWEVWILPNLWSDTAMIWEIFTPVYTVQRSAGSAWYWRLGLAVATVGSVYWVASQPGELDKFLSSNKQFVDDLYAGTLLTDGSGPGTGLSTGSASYGGGPFGNYGPNRYGQRPAHIPKFEEVLRSTSEEEEAASSPAPGETLSSEDGATSTEHGDSPSSEPDLEAMLQADMAQEDGTQEVRAVQGEEA